LNTAADHSPPQPRVAEVELRGSALHRARTGRTLPVAFADPWRCRRHRPLQLQPCANASAPWRSRTGPRRRTRWAPLLPVRRAKRQPHRRRTSDLPLTPPRAPLDARPDYVSGFVVASCPTESWLMYWRHFGKRLYILPGNTVVQTHHFPSCWNTSCTGTCRIVKWCSRSMTILSYAGEP